MESVFGVGRRRVRPAIRRPCPVRDSTKWEGARESNLPFPTSLRAPAIGIESTSTAGARPVPAPAVASSTS